MSFIHDEKRLLLQDPTLRSDTHTTPSEVGGYEDEIQEEDRMGRGGREGVAEPRPSVPASRVLFRMV